MISLSVTLYLFNLAEDGKWNGTLLGKYETYLPLAIQFFFGALSSAYVVYFSRTVSLSKTAIFFILLLVMLLANEMLKQRMSNKYLQFGVYSFLSFTFFSFIIPVFISEMNSMVFVLSGLASLVCTLTLVTVTYLSSQSTRNEVRGYKLYGLVLGVYLLVYAFYFLKIIPPVPLALDCGIVAHHVSVSSDKYMVTFERDEWYKFWRINRIKYVHEDGRPIYFFSSVFAPTSLEKSIMHRWLWYNEISEEWDVVDNIPFEIVGGRDGGYRGYTYKENVKTGRWKVQVLTDDELLIGVVDFEVVVDDQLKPSRLVERAF